MAPRKACLSGFLRVKACHRSNVAVTYHSVRNRKNKCLVIHIHTQTVLTIPDKSGNSRDTYFVWFRKFWRFPHGLDLLTLEGLRHNSNLHTRVRWHDGGGCRSTKTPKLACFGFCFLPSKRRIGLFTAEASLFLWNAF
ncbi:unnamed protein product [Laminaria digitata]